MTTSDKPREVAFALPKKAGNKTSSVVLKLGTTKFECRRVIDGISLLNFAQLAGKLESDDPDHEASASESAEAAGAILTLLRKVIIDWPRFEKFVAENDIEVEQLGEYAAGLVEQYTDRPTPSPSGS